MTILTSTGTLPIILKDRSFTETFNIVDEPLVFTIFPLGDSSRLVHFGEVHWGDSIDLSRQALLKELSFKNELHYLVDFIQPTPEVVVQLEGRIIDYEYPYILLYTGYNYELVHDYYINKHSDQSELIVIDLTKTKKILNVSLEDSIWGARLTADGHLVFTSQDYLEAISTGIDRKNFYNKVLYRIVEWNLESGDSTSGNAIVPYGMLDERCYDYVFSMSRSISFLDPQGKARFVQYPGGWGFHVPDFFYMGSLFFLLHRGRFFYAPGVCDLVNNPYRTKWIKVKMGKWWLCNWFVSPHKRWLFLNYRRKPGKMRDTTWTFVVPLDALTDSSAFDLDLYQEFKVPAYCDWYYDFYFTPDERWMIFKPWGGYNDEARLFSCDQRGVARPLLDSNEENEDGGLGDVYLSPGGRYVAYTCKIADKPGAYLQVRRMPE